MNIFAQRFAAYSGIAFIILFLIPFVFMLQWVPPIPPTWTSAQVAKLFADNSLTIRAATAVMMLGTPLGFMWSASIACWTGRTEGNLPVLAVTQAICSLFAFGGAYFIVVAWSSAAFRPDRPEEIVYLLSDQGWYWVVMMASAAVLQMVCIGISILSDTSQQPVFPRWVGYFNIWIGVLSVPGSTLPFFKTGPFAWDGLFAFYIPLTVFSFWIYVNTYFLHRAINREAALQRAAAGR